MKIWEFHHYQEAFLQWEKNIESSHPVISYFPIERWPEVAKFNGWLPLPPEKPTITPQQRMRLKLGLAERMKVRRRKEQERRNHFYR